MPDHVIDLPQAAQIATTAAEQVYAIPELMDMIYALVEKQSQGSHGDHFWYDNQARQEVLQGLMCLALSHKAGYRRVAKFLYRQINLSALLKMIESKHDPERLETAFGAIRKLYMREADMRRNSNSQWDIGDSCHLTWLKNLQSIHWLPWWDQDMLVRFGPKVMQVEETHIIGGRQLVVHGWLRLSDTHPWETSILPIADSEGTLWGTTCHGDYFDLDDDMSDLAPEGAAPNMVSLFRSVPTSSRYAVHDMSEVLLVREANRISNGGKGGLLFARMKEINCAENLEKRGFIPDDLARILSLCPNLEKLEVKLIPGEDQRNLERSLTDLTPKLRWIYLDAVELACLPHLTHCEYVELIISGDLQPKLPPDDRSSSKTRRHKGVSQIETLIIDFDVTPLYIDPAQLANFTVSWASKDAEITVQAVHVYVDEDTPASKWIRKVNSAIAVLQKRSPKVPSDGSSPAISAVVDR